MERKLVTLRKISELKPIEGADRIELAIIDGWQVVTQKGIHEVGDLVFYFEIDSFLPTNRKEFEWLKPTNGKVTVYNGVEGHRLRTIKLKKMISQGLILPANVLWDYGNAADIMMIYDDDYAEFFKVRKWETPLPAELVGTVRSTFPTHIIPKTDQERVQNILGDLLRDHTGELFEVTLKLDGSSMTVYKYNDYIGVCSRNMDLIEGDNTFWRVARDQGLIEWLTNFPGNYALQGELMGEGIQGNPEKIKGQKFFLFDIYDIDSQRYLSPIERQQIAKDFGMNHTPNMGGFSWSNEEDRETLLNRFFTLAGGGSLNLDNPREGVVLKSHKNPAFSFKVISNTYLLNEK